MSVRSPASVSEAGVSEASEMLGRAGLRGARVAFTGRLASMTRREAQHAVRRAGGNAATSVTTHTAVLVVGSRGFPIRADGRVTCALERAEELLRRGVGIRIVGEDEFLTMLRGGTVLPESDGTKSFPLEKVASLVGVAPEKIERWEHLGLVRSSDGLYDFQDIVSLQSIASLVRSGAKPHAIQRSLHGLSGVLPGLDRPLAQLKIVVASSGELLAQIGESLIDPHGQQHLDFERWATEGDGLAEMTPGSMSSLAASAGEKVSSGHAVPDDPDECFERALSCEEDERFEEAVDLYRRAIALAPGWAEAHFNLANVLRLLERDEGAEEIYHLAVSLDPSNELAWYNLADLQEEDGRLEEAVESLGVALRACPSFSDAHFNIAACLEQLGDRHEAQVHWHAYLKLDPDSEWASIAQDHLKQLSNDDRSV